MSTKFLRRCILLCATAGWAASALAETTVCTVIASLPYTITTSGNFCLTASINTPIATGAAITINAGSVMLDLNGFRIGGAAAGTGTQTYGIYGNNRSNVTIRNGNIRGFYKGIFLEETGAAGTSKANLIEDVLLDQNRFTAIHVKGVGNIVRNVQVVDTGNTTLSNDARGIWINGAANRVLNCDVSNTSPKVGGQAYSIYLENATGSVVEGNRVGNPTSLSNATAIQIMSGDAQVVGSRMTAFGFGIVFVGTGSYRDNLASSVTTPYTGGSDAGNNYPTP